MFLKIIEHILSKLTKYFRFNDNQHEFRPNLSTCKACFSLKTLFNYLRKICICCFLDYSNAFDNISYEQHYCICRRYFSSFSISDWIKAFNWYNNQCAKKYFSIRMHWEPQSGCKIFVKQKNILTNSLNDIFNKLARKLYFFC